MLRSVPIESRGSYFTESELTRGLERTRRSSVTVTTNAPTSKGGRGPIAGLGRRIDCDGFGGSGTGREGELDAIAEADGLGAKLAVVVCPGDAEELGTGLPHDASIVASMTIEPSQRTIALLRPHMDNTMG